MKPELTFNPQFETLLSHCETKCVKQCCGLEAFNFSPIDLAFFLRRNTTVSMTIIDAELDQLGTIANSINPENSPTWFSPFLNEEINTNGLKNLVKEIRHNLILAAKLISISEDERYER